MLGLPSRELSRLIALDELRIVLAIAAADLNQHRRLEVEAALVVMLDAITVLLRRELRSGPLAGIDTQPRTLDVLVIDDPLAVAGRDVVAARVIRNFDDFPEDLVRLLLARARVLVAKVVVPTRPLRSSTSSTRRSTPLSPIPR